MNNTAFNYSLIFENKNISILFLQNKYQIQYNIVVKNYFAEKQYEKQKNEKIKN